MLLHKMFGEKLKLRSKMFIVFGVLCSLIVITMTLIRLYGSTLFADTGAIYRITNDAYSKVQIAADYQKDVLQKHLANSLAELYRLDNNGLIQEACGQRSQKNDQFLTDKLAYFAKTSVTFLTITLVTADKREIIATSQPELNIAKISQRFIAQAISNPDTVTIYNSPIQQKSRHSIYFIKAIGNPENNKPHAVLIAKTTTNLLFDNSINIERPLGQTGAMLIATATGELLYQQQSSAGAQVITATISPPLMSALVAGKEGLFRKLVDYRGNKVIAVIRTINVADNQHWKLIVKQDWSITQRLLNSRIYSMSFTGVVEIMLVLLAVFFITRRLTRPLSVLAQAAQRVQRDELVPVDLINASYEEVHLATAFNKMIARIADWQHDLEAEVTIKTAQLAATNNDLLKTQQHQTAIADITNHYLRSGEIKAAFELLLQRLKICTGSTMGGIFKCDKTTTDQCRITSLTEIINTHDSATTKDKELSSDLETFILTLLHEQLNDLDLHTNGQQSIIVNEQQLKQRAGYGAAAAIKSLLIQPIIQGDTLYGAIVQLNSPDNFTRVDNSGLNAFTAASAMIFHAEQRENARVAAEQAERLQGEFLANISHEIRTPINVVVGMSNLLLATETTNVQQNYLQKINSSSQQLLALINDILDVAKLKAGYPLQINIVPFEPEQLLRDVVNLLTYNFDDRLVELHVDISREVPRVLNGDNQRLRQILNNLLGNAIKFTEQGDIVLAVKVLKQSATDVTLEFRVSDSGVGIAPRELETLFHPFTQVDSSLTRKHGGTGLGLTISHQLCRLMGGELHANSIAGEGSVFSFCLNFSIPLTENTQSSPLVPPSTLRGMRVLAVDDNAICRRLLVAMLEAMQFTATSASSGQQALEMLQQAAEQDTPFSLVLLDSSMPQMSGIDVARHIITQELSHAPRIMMVTAKEKEKLLCGAEDLDIAAIIDKPVQASTLFDAIQQLFGYRPTISAPSPDIAIQWQDVKLLLVEDRELNRQVARGLLEHIGITVVDAINGAVAVAMVQTGNYDLVLMDIQMPVMDGLTATRKIRQLTNQSMQQLPIIAMTANAFAKDRQTSLQAGMNDHINKPIDPAELYALLKRWLPAQKLQVPAPKAETDDSEEIAFPSAVAGIDIPTGLLYAGGNKQLYLSLLTGFANRFTNAEIQLRQHLAAGEHDHAIRLVHTLKGLSATMGAKQLNELAAKLEAQLREDQPPTYLEQMLIQLELVRSACAHLPQPKDEADESELPIGTNENLRQILIKLEPALTNADALLCRDLTKLLHQRRWSALFATNVDQLNRLIAKYHYSEAKRLLEKLQQRL